MRFGSACITDAPAQSQAERKELGLLLPAVCVCVERNAVLKGLLRRTYDGEVEAVGNFLGTKQRRTNCAVALVRCSGTSFLSIATGPSESEDPA